MGSGVAPHLRGAAPHVFAPSTPNPRPRCCSTRSNEDRRTTQPRAHINYRHGWSEEPCEYQVSPPGACSFVERVFA
jgi:hypothetical protein